MSADSKVYLLIRFIKLENAGIGVCPWCIEHAKVTPTLAQLSYRFDLISKFGFNQIAVPTTTLPADSPNDSLGGEKPHLLHKSSEIWTD